MEILQRQNAKSNIIYLGFISHGRVIFIDGWNKFNIPLRIFPHALNPQNFGASSMKVKIVGRNSLRNSGSPRSSSKYSSFHRVKESQIRKARQYLSIFWVGSSSFSFLYPSFTPYCQLAHLPRPEGRFNQSYYFHQNKEGGRVDRFIIAPIPPHDTSRKKGVATCSQHTKGQVTSGIEEDEKRD